MSNRNKLEITIISKTSNLDKDKLKFYFDSQGLGSIKKCKVLNGRMKAFITFEDVKSYDAALILSSNTFSIFPSNISLADVYKNQKMIQNDLGNVFAGIDRVLDGQDELVKITINNFQRLESRLTYLMLFIADELKLDVHEIVDKMGLIDYDQSDQEKQPSEPEKQPSEQEKQPSEPAKQPNLKSPNFVNIKYATGLDPKETEKYTHQKNDTQKEANNGLLFNLKVNNDGQD